MRERYHHESLGTNFKPTDLAAALGLAQLAATRRADRAAPAERRTAHRGAARLPDAGACRRAASTSGTSTRCGSRASGSGSLDGLTERGIGTLDLLPDPGPPPGVPPGVRAGRARRSTCRSPTGSPTRCCRSRSARASPTTRSRRVIARRPGGRHAGRRRARSPRLRRIVTARRSGSGSPVSARWAATISATSSTRDDVRPGGGGRPGAGARSTTPWRGPARSASPTPLAMIAEAPLDAVVIAAPDDLARRARAGRPRARPARPRREAARRDRRGGHRPRGRGPSAGRAAPGRPHRALQPGRARAGPPAGRGLGRARSTRSRAAARGRSRRESATSASRSTSRPTTPTSSVVGRRRAADARLRRDRPATCTPRNEDLLFGLLHFPSGATGMLDVNWLTPAKRRQLSVVGEVGMFELDYLTQRLTFTQRRRRQPDDDRRLRDDLRGQRRRHRRRPATSRLRRSSTRSSRVARSGGRPVVDGEDGLWALAIASGCSRPPPRRRPVDLAGVA